MGEEGWWVGAWRMGWVVDGRGVGSDEVQQWMQAGLQGAWGRSVNGGFKDVGGIRGCEYEEFMFVFICNKDTSG